MRWEMNTEFGLPQIFVEQLEIVAKNVKDNRADCLGLFVGGERLGKSTLQTRVAMTFEKFLGTELKLRRDYHYELRSFIKSCLEVPYPDNDGKLYPKKGGLHYIKVYDEPVLGANARKWASEGNVLLNQAFATIGYKYLITLASIPSIWMLDNMIREHRVAFMCSVTGKVSDDGMIQKGFFNLYNGKAVKKIYKDRETRQTHYPRTKFMDMRFQSMEGTAFWNQYEEFSAKAKQDTITDLLNETTNLKPTSRQKAEIVNQIIYGDANGG